MKRIHTFAMTALGLSALLLSACSKPAVQTQTAAETKSQTQPAAEVQTAASEAKTEAETEGKAEAMAEEDFFISTISEELFARMKGKSYKDNCTVPVEDLRYLHVLHKDLTGKTCEGEMVCNKAIAADVLDILRQLYEADYPIEKIRLVDEYDADDEASMEDNNSSCFNFRFISHTTKVSKHGLGLAVDINTLYNPYTKLVDGKRIIEPVTGEPYLDRSADFPCKIDENDLCYKLFMEKGFEWGGAWTDRKDYQHFELPDAAIAKLYPDMGYEVRNADRPDQYIDLHLHLDGSLTPDIAKQLAELQGITLPAKSDEELSELLMVPEDCASLNEFLERFQIPDSLLQTPEGLTEAVRLVCENIRSQHVVYAELRWAPQLHTMKGMTQEEAILAALEGLKQTDLKANMILCFMRGEGNEAENEETLRLAKKYLVEDGGVVAVDLAGAEALYPTENYRELFAKARNLGVPFTIHAGEAAGADSVKLAIEYGAARIGHGVRSFEDPEVLKMLKEREIPLEMAPTSNRQTHAVEDMSKYPLKDYLEAGIRVTLNTDDMGIEGTTLAKEFQYAEQEFGLTPEQQKTMLANAVDAAFTTDEVKQELRKTLGLE